MKKVLFLVTFCLFMAIGSSFGAMYIFCDHWGQCWSGNDNGFKGDVMQITWTPCGGCPPNDTWMYQVNCTPVVFSDGNGGNTDGQGHALDQNMTLHLIANLNPSAPTGNPPQEVIDAYVNATQLGIFAKVYVDGTQFSPSVRSYLLSCNPTGYPN
jgi:hypothetical protein